VNITNVLIIQTRPAAQPCLSGLTRYTLTLTSCMNSGRDQVYITRIVPFHLNVTALDKLFTHTVAACAFRRGGVSCLLAARDRPLRNVRTVRVDHFSYRTHSQWCLPVPVLAVPDPRRRFLPRLHL